MISNLSEVDFRKAGGWKHTLEKNAHTSTSRSAHNVGPMARSEVSRKMAADVYVIEHTSN